MKISIYVYLLVAVSFVSCKKDLAQSITIKDIVKEISYVKEFPNSYTLKNKKTPDIKQLGMNDFKVYDSLLIVSKKSSTKFLSFYSLPNYRKLGDFLNKGRGPFEVAYPPDFINKETVCKEKGTQYMYIFSGLNGRLTKMNIDKSIDFGKAEYELVRDSLSNSIFVCIPMDSTHIFIRKIEDRNTRINRYILKEKTKKTTPLLDKLNLLYVEEGEDFNILGTYIKYNRKNKKFVEMSISMNYIMLYKLNDDLPKVICVEEQLRTLKTVQRVYRINRLEQLKGLRSFDDFFGVIYSKGAKVYNEFNPKNIRASILLFNWNGEPLAKLKLDEEITSFDIDFQNDVLYTFKYYEENSFYKYDIKDVLEDLKN